MTWLWDASVSPDVAVYVIYLCVSVSPGVCSPWMYVDDTPALTYTVTTPPPTLGHLHVWTVEARDLAGNESARE